MGVPGLPGTDVVGFVLYCKIGRRRCLVKILVKSGIFILRSAHFAAPALFYADKLKLLLRSCTIEPMATYVISDIHGALTEFRNLLEKIDFHYDGRDALYLLGDYCDWGADPIGTLQLVKEMDEEYPFVHCLIGNHEWMFLETIAAEARGARGMDSAEANWFFNNRGLATWNAYIRLPLEEQREISVWMAALPYSAQVTVNGVSYLLSHAYPYFDDVQYSPEEDVRRKTDAVWRRLMIRENPFAGYTGSGHYDRFICGHTITEFYFYKLRFERGWPLRKPDPSVRNRIFKGERFIDIDCGAKCMSCAEDPSAALRRGAGRAQLACLRLDDMHEFYQHPVKHRMPRLDLQDPTRPFARLAELEPKMTLPGVRPSEMALPEIDLSDLKFPEAHLPKVKFRQMTLDDLRTMIGLRPADAEPCGEKDDETEQPETKADEQG